MGVVIGQILTWLFLALALCQVQFIINAFARRRRAGAILFDLGRAPARYQRRSAYERLVEVGAALIGLAAQAFHQPRAFEAVYPIYLGLWGLHLLLLSGHRIAICDAGILGAGGFTGVMFYRWEDIVCYYVEKNGTLRLKLRGDRWTTWGRPVPNERRQDVETLMSSRCPRLQQAVGV